MGSGLGTSERAPCAMGQAGTSGTVLMVAGDTGKCPGEDPAPGGPSGVFHIWCNPSKGAGLADTQARDPHTES